ncbi:MAG TPA: hypothetical protein VGX23_22715 [Actinocrinis sp.]|nr:hypothetical protein [Actinocrinis sp.]
MSANMAADRDPRPNGRQPSPGGPADTDPEPLSKADSEVVSGVAAEVASEVNSEPPSTPSLSTLPRSTVAAPATESAAAPTTAPTEVLPESSQALQTVRRRLLPKWTGWLLLVLGFLTLPWIGGLAVELPSRSEAAHYDVSWTGFDVLLCLLLLRTGWSAVRDLEHVELTAAMTGALLIVDAWFDVMSAPDTKQFLIALGMAVCVELPLAVFCLWIAGRVEFERKRRSEVLTALVRRFENRRKQAPERRQLRLHSRSHR